MSAREFLVKSCIVLAYLTVGTWLLHDEMMAGKHLDVLFIMVLVLAIYIIVSCIFIVQQRRKRRTLQ